MKVKNYFKVLTFIVLICVLLMSFTISSSAFAEKDSLPEIVRWNNGAAQTTDGTYLSDTWAIDTTNVSNAKYVLINQDGLEEMRVKNYPDDISAGNIVSTPTYVVSLKLRVPESITNEVVITLENSNATYILVLNEENAYSKSESFYPGEYEVGNIEVAGTEQKYSLSEDLLLNVSDKDLSISLELTELRSVADGSEGGSEGSSEEAEGESALDVVKKFDTNGDLLWDTVALCIAVVILLAVYVFIQYKRKKAEEINR